MGLCLGCLYGSTLLNRQPIDACVTDETAVKGVVQGLVDTREIRPGQTRQRFRFRVMRWQPVECTGPQVLLLSYYGDERIESGKILHLRIGVKRNWGQANPGSVSFQAWYAFAGIDATGTVKSVLKRQTARSIDTAGLLVHQRAALLDRIDTAALSGFSKALLKALVAGDKSGITQLMWQRFAVLGINHLFVISGLHIGLVAAFGYGLGAGLSRLIQLFQGPPLLLIAPLCSLAFAFFYAGLAGFSLSTLRALLMTACFLLASLLSRASRPWQGFLIAACGVLLLNPLSSLSAGFWLSFLAVAWLLWVNPFLGVGQRSVAPHPLRSRILRVAMLHVSLCLLMLPLTLLWFGGASVIAPMANVVFVPMVSFFVVPVVLLGTALAFLDAQIGYWIWEVAMWPLATLLSVLEQVAGSWLRQLYWPGATRVLDVVLMLAGLVLWPLLTSWRARILACVLFVPALLPAPVDNRGISVSFLDVGQGTAIVVQAGQRVLIYDTGGGDPLGHNNARSVIAPFLRHHGVNQIDTLVVSHPDLDHSAGVRTLLAQFPVGQAYVSQSVTGLADAAICRTGLAFSWPGGVQFQFLAPSNPALHSSNNASCVLQVTLPGGDVVLLAGDINTQRELELVRFWRGKLASDYLLAAHHGSRTSTSPAWLKWVSPQVVIVTHGQANSFGHPHTEVVSRIRSAAIEFESTAEHGALLFHTGPMNQLVYRRWRSGLDFYWL